MIQIIPSSNRHFTDMGWLKTYWLFSFSDYYDPENINHGSLRVFNDDIVMPDTGFATHPHEEMEIVSIVLQGKMEHRDTMGNIAVIKKNDVQRMTAGTGLQHSEWNSGEEEVHFFQIWIIPDKKKLAPSYDQKSFSPEAWQNKLALLAGEKEGDNVLLNTDAQIYRAHLFDRKEITYATEEQRNLFIYVISGEGTVNGREIANRDQARITHNSELTLMAGNTLDIVLVDIPA